MVGGEQDVVLLGHVADGQSLGGGARGLQRRRHHERDDLAPVVDGVVLQQSQVTVIDLGEPGHVLVAEHGQHTGPLPDDAAVDGG